MDNRKENLIVKMTFDFSVEAMNFAEKLEEKRKYTVAKQFLKSATSIGANVREAQNAESKNDFIHKMKIALKEVEETEYWLQLCKASEYYPTDEALLNRAVDINRVLSKIVGSAKRNVKESKTLSN